jgi:2-desacetyl-2-hydroxyethyl bacteriochlorophyllide A dehydrogenase
MLQEFDVNSRALAPREILVRTSYSAVSNGTEVSVFTASDPDVYEADGWCRYPCEMGYSGVGNVVARGIKVTEFDIGDRVIGQLGHASHWTLDVDRMIGPEWLNRPVSKANPRIEDRQAAFVRLAGIAMTPIQLLRRHDYPVVGVWGLGIIGNLAAQLLRCSGCTVVGVDPDSSRRRAAERVGIDLALDPVGSDFRAHLETAAPEGLAAIVDTVGSSGVTIRLPSFIRMRGELVLLTHWRSQPVVDSSLFVNEIFRKGLSVHGGLEYGPGSAPWENWAALQFAKWESIQRLVVAGRIDMSNLITRVVRPGDHAQVYNDLADGHSGNLGLLVDWREVKGVT